MKRCTTGLATVALLLGGVGQARAVIVQLTSAGQLNGSDTTAVYAGSDGTHLPSPVVLLSGGNTLTFSDSPSVGFLRADQDATWTPGAFAPGTHLLWNVDSTGSVYGGPNTIGFAPGVMEMGLSVQQDNPANTTFTAMAFSNGNPTPALTIMVTVPNSGGNGSLGFIGFQATGADAITSVVISSTDASSSKFNNDFAMGPVTFGAVPVISSVPEPSTLALAGLCTLGALARGWRRRRRPGA